jgi:oligoribonuclease NrnB/cAMP/cGMP phosphodiesterase (DHH superfamily)
MKIIDSHDKNILWPVKFNIDDARKRIDYSFTLESEELLIRGEEESLGIIFTQRWEDETKKMLDGIIEGIKNQNNKWWKFIDETPEEQFLIEKMQEVLSSKKKIFFSHANDSDGFFSALWYNMLYPDLEPIFIDHPFADMEKIIELVIKLNDANLIVASLDINLFDLFPQIDLETSSCRIVDHHPFDKQLPSNNNHMININAPSVTDIIHNELSIAGKATEETKFFTMIVNYLDQGKLKEYCTSNFSQDKTIKEQFKENERLYALAIHLIIAAYARPQLMPEIFKLFSEKGVINSIHDPTMITLIEEMIVKEMHTRQIANSWPKSKFLIVIDLSPYETVPLTRFIFSQIDKGQEKAFELAFIIKPIGGKIIQNQWNLSARGSWDYQPLVPEDSPISFSTLMRTIFSGGGHRFASGGTCDYEKIVPKLDEAIKEIQTWGYSIKDIDLIFYFSQKPKERLL